MITDGVNAQAFATFSAAESMEVAKMTQILMDISSELSLKIVLNSLARLGNFWETDGQTDGQTDKASYSIFVFK